jgi:hypothetical protein
MWPGAWSTCTPRTSSTGEPQAKKRLAGDKMQNLVSMYLLVPRVRQSPGLVFRYNSLKASAAYRYERSQADVRSSGFQSPGTVGTCETYIALMLPSWSRR